MRDVTELLPTGALRMAERLTNVTSWQGLVPVAFAIMALHRPRLLVELGTHLGDSYCAFCQAVEMEKLDTRCFAIDTWTGDEQAGKYGPEILSDLKAHHDPRYSEFSTLLQSTFDDAVGQFQDGSIDLLHIDGLHTYDAVKHDFETWKPKLSLQALVLFHDIDVGDGDFRVGRLWAELRQLYPFLEFHFSHGLGVLAVGEPSTAMKRWFELSPGEFRPLHDLLEALGRRITLEAETREANIKVDELTAMLKAQTAKTHNEWSQRVAKDKELAQKNELLSQAKEHLWTAERQMAALREADRRLREEGFAQQRRLSEAEARAEFYRAEHHKAITSRSWRVTAPLRVATALLSGNEEKTHSTSKRSAASSLTNAGDSQQRSVFQVPNGQDAWNRLGQQRLQKLLRSDHYLDFTKADNPLLSIVMVFYNKAHLSLLALESLLYHADVEYELLIVDNASTDSTGELLHRLKNVQVIQNRANLGFGPACMQASAVACGQYLCFLNNDALLQEHALSIALENFNRSPNVGAVGGKILLADGRLQEAGSIIWCDGSALGYGRASDPEANQYIFRRPVDYCSGAFLFTPRMLFTELGGFSERYAPAYYEDTDYCLKVWESGHQVLYEPCAVVRHYESASSGDNDSAKPLMAAHQKKFVADWSGVLHQHQEPIPRSILRARIASESPGLRILYLDDRIPHRELGSGFPRSNDVVRDLVALGHHVSCVSLNFPIDSKQNEYRDIPREVELVDGYGKRDAILEDYAPASDIVWVSRPHNMELLLRYLMSINRGVVPKVVYDAEAIFSERDQLKREIVGHSLPAHTLQAWSMRETALAQAADVVITVSERDAREMTSRGIRDVQVVGHRLEVVPTPGTYSQRAAFLFVGAVHGRDNPNLDSLHYFCGDIWPTVFDATGAELLVAGYGTESLEQELKMPGVRVIGAQDSLRSVYGSARAFIVPTRYCAGIPYKAHEAAAHGVPMVVSPIILDQLGWTKDKDCLSGEDRESFAQACIRLYGSEVLWNQLRSNALTRVAEELNSVAFSRAIKTILEEVRSGHSVLQLGL